MTSKAKNKALEPGAAIGKCGIRVRALQAGGRRRAGRHFSTEGEVFVEGALSDNDLKIIAADAYLKVELVEFDAETSAAITDAENGA